MRQKEACGLIHGEVEGGIIKTRITILCLVALITLASGIWMFLTASSQSSGFGLVETRIKARNILHMVESLSHHYSAGSNPWALWPSVDNTGLIIGERSSCLENTPSCFENWLSSMRKSCASNLCDTELSILRDEIIDHSGNSKWSFLLNVNDNTSDRIPVMITGNMDVASLVNGLIGLKSNDVKYVDHGLYLTKDGTCYYVCSNYFSSNLIKSQGNAKMLTDNWPNNLVYITPKGPVLITVQKSDGVGGRKNIE